MVTTVNKTRIIVVIRLNYLLALNRDMFILMFVCITLLQIAIVIMD